MTIKRPILNHECHIRKLSLIQHVVNSEPQSILLITIFGIVLIRTEIRTGVCVKNINIFQVILSIATTDNVQFAIDKCHGMTCTRIWIGIVLCIQYVVTMLPR